MTMQRIIGGGAAALAVLAIAAGAALAAQQRTQPAPPVKPSFKDMLGVGYEVKAVTYVPKEALRSSATDPAVLVTMQKGSAVAVCEFYPGNWSTLVASSMEGNTQCDTYPAFVK